jgi:hypothetical protein
MTPAKRYNDSEIAYLLYTNAVQFMGEEDEVGRNRHHPALPEEDGAG